MESLLLQLFKRMPRTKIARRPEGSKGIKGTKRMKGMKGIKGFGFGVEGVGLGFVRALCRPTLTMTILGYFGGLGLGYDYSFSPPSVDRTWLWVYYHKILIYPILYLLKGDYKPLPETQNPKPKAPYSICLRGLYTWVGKDP